MAGTVIVIATLIGYVVGHVLTSDPMSASGILVLGLMTGLGLVGFVDDFIKIYRQTSLGLRSGAKLAGQSVVGAIFAIEVINHPDAVALTPANPSLSFLRDFGPAIGVLPFVLWIVIMIGATSNAVNLTDGLDGLATGAAILVLAAYVLIANWQLRNDCTVALAKNCYAVRDPLDLAVVAPAVLVACFGFLWRNAPPARPLVTWMGCRRGRSPRGRRFRRPRGRTAGWRGRARRFRAASCPGDCRAGRGGCRRGLAQR